MLFVAWCSVSVNLYFSFLKNVQSLLAWDLQNFLIGSEDFLVEFFGNFNLKSFGPVTDIKKTWFYNLEGILLTDLLPKIIMQLSKSHFFLFWRESGSLFFLKDKEIFCFLHKCFIDIIIFGHFGHGGYISGEYLIFHFHIINDISYRIDNVAISSDSKELNEHDDDNFWNTDWRDIAITDSKHGC